MSEETEEGNLDMAAFFASAPTVDCKAVMMVMAMVKMRGQEALPHSQHSGPESTMCGCCGGNLLVVKLFSSVA